METTLQIIVVGVMTLSVVATLMGGITSLIKTGHLDQRQFAGNIFNTTARVTIDSLLVIGFLAQLGATLLALFSGTYRTISFFLTALFLTAIIYFKPFIFKHKDNKISGNTPSEIIDSLQLILTDMGPFNGLQFISTRYITSEVINYIKRTFPEPSNVNAMPKFLETLQLINSEFMQRISEEYKPNMKGEKNHLTIYHIHRVFQNTFSYYLSFDFKREESLKVVLPESIYNKLKNEKITYRYEGEEINLGDLLNQLLNFQEPGILYDYSIVKDKILIPTGKKTKILQILYACFHESSGQRLTSDDHILSNFYIQGKKDSTKGPLYVPPYEPLHAKRVNNTRPDTNVVSRFLEAFTGHCEEPELVFVHEDFCWKRVKG